MKNIDLAEKSGTLQKFISEAISKFTSNSNLNQIIGNKYFCNNKIPK